jgi:hypothetical protein
MRLIRGPSSFLGCRLNSAIRHSSESGRALRRPTPGVCGARAALARIRRGASTAPHEATPARVWPCRCRRNRVFMNAGETCEEKIRFGFWLRRREIAASTW